MTPNAGSTTTSSGPSGSRAVVGVAEELDAFAAQAIVDVRVVDDFARQKHAAVGKSLARLIGIIDGAVDAVAEPELAREMDRETAGPILKIVGLNLLNEIAVVVLIQLCRDRIFQVEALAEHEREVIGSFPNVAHFADLERGRHEIDRAQIGAHFAHARADERLVDVDEELVVGRGLQRQRRGRLRLLNGADRSAKMAAIHREAEEDARGETGSRGARDPAARRPEHAMDAGCDGTR